MENDNRGLPESVIKQVEECLQIARQNPGASVDIQAEVTEVNGIGIIEKNFGISLSTQSGVKPSNL